MLGKAIHQTKIENQIYTIRGVQVILDSHLADFYQVKPIRLREQVKRNTARFPEDFMFRLNEIEINYMVSQNAIPSIQHLGGSFPYVFTEQGVAAMAAVIKSEQAVTISIQIIRAFVAMRKQLIPHALIDLRLSNMERNQLENDQKFERVFKALENRDTTPQQGIFYDGQVFDAYIFVTGIIRAANHSIILIDNYIDDTVLTLLTKRNPTAKAQIYTQKIDKQLQLDFDKYNLQYPPVEINIFKNVHDRFLIIDEKELYHIGASLKDLGKKWFAFSKMNDFTAEILLKIKTNAQF
jgi:hypothetical protein